MKKPLVVDTTTAIICWEDKILLFLRDNKPGIPDPNTWQLPGGGIENGETPDVAIKRELLEEISYVPENLKFWTKLRKPDGKSVYVYYAFVDNTEAEKFKIGKTEGEVVSFFTLNEIEDLKLTSGIKEYFSMYKGDLKKVLENKSFENFVL